MRTSENSFYFVYLHLAYYISLIHHFVNYFGSNVLADKLDLSKPSPS